MGSLVGSIEYRLPRTECLVTASRREAVIARGGSSWLEPVVDVSVVPELVADADHARILEVEHSIGETLSLDITLDEQGVVTAVNSSSSVDFTPIIDLVGKAVGIAATAAAGGIPVAAFAKETGTEAPKSLEQQWQETHSALAGHLEALNAQSARLLKTLSDEKSPIGEIIEASKALETVQAQMAAIIEVRRLWIAAKETVENVKVRLAPDDLCLIGGAGMPDQMSDAEVHIPAEQKKLAKEIGCLIAVHDPKRPEVIRSSRTTTQPGILITLVPRQVRIAVYLHETDGWKPDAESVRMLNLVDHRSKEREIELSRRSIAFSLHRDGTFKTFSLKKASMLSGAAKSIIGAADTLQAERGKIAKANAEAAKQAAAEKAKQASDLTSLNRNDYEFLALIHGRGKPSP